MIEKETKILIFQKNYSKSLLSTSISDHIDQDKYVEENNPFVYDNVLQDNRWHGGGLPLVLPTKKFMKAEIRIYNPLLTYVIFM